MDINVGLDAHHRSYDVVHARNVSQGVIIFMSLTLPVSNLFVDPASNRVYPRRRRLLTSRRPRSLYRMGLPNLHPRTDPFYILHPNVRPDSTRPPLWRAGSPGDGTITCNVPLITVNIPSEYSSRESYYCRQPPRSVRAAEQRI